MFAVGAGVALAAALGARLPGQTATGDSQASKQSSAAPTNAQLIKRLEDAIAKNPNDTQTRMLLAPRLEATGDLAGALTQYDAVVKVDPTNAVAEAQAGRIIYLSAEAAVKSNPDAAAQLVAQSKARLEHAIELDGNYADAYYFHAIVLANEYGDFAGAQNDLQHYLVLAPNGTWVGQAQQLIADVTNAIDADDGVATLDDEPVDRRSRQASRRTDLPRETGKDPPWPSPPNPRSTNRRSTARPSRRIAAPSSWTSTRSSRRTRSTTSSGWHARGTTTA